MIQKVNNQKERSQERRPPKRDSRLLFIMDDVLKYAVENGMIDMTYIREQIEMNKRKELLEKHPYKIWEGKDGKWYTYLPDDEKGRRLVKRTQKQSIEDEVAKYWEEELENPTIQEVFTEWNDRRLELGKISKSTHLRNHQVFNRHYKEFGEKHIKNIRPEEIEDFLEEQVPKHNLTAKAFSNLKTITRGLLKRAKKRKLIDFNVEEIFQELDMSDADFQKVIKEDYQEVFDEEETSKMIQYLEENLDIVNIGILLMFVTGIRVGELVALKHIDFNKDSFRVRRTETYFKTKEGRYVFDVKEFPKSQAGVRTVVVPHNYEWLLEKISSTTPDSEYVFVKRNKRITTKPVRMRLKNICEKLGIYKKSPHKIRKTYGTILLDNNIDSQLIIGQMGHTNIMCTENHYHRNRRSIKNKSEIISSIPEFCQK